MREKLDKKTEELVQDHWKKKELLQIDGILYGNGLVVQMESYQLISETNKNITIRPVCDTSVESILKYNPEPWIEVVPYTSVAQDSVSGDHIICGEGEMGNEGFVARVNALTGNLIWGAFFTFSNPFMEVEIINNEIVAHSSHGHKWFFPIDKPENIKIEL